VAPPRRLPCRQSPQLLSYSLFHLELEKRFEDSYPAVSNVTLPAAGEAKSLEEEIRLYGQLHAEEEFAGFAADPELSAQMLLRKENAWSQSVYFLGREVSQVLLEVAVTHQEGEHRFDNQTVEVHLLNCETREVLLKEKVKHIRLLRAEVVS
jgi:hypothetical protein